MNREIKFRAWSIEHERMQYFDSHKHGVQYAYGVLAVSTGWDGYDRPVYESDTSKSHIIMQWTGIKDKNGKDVYEGDIVKQHFFFFDGHSEGEREFEGVIKWSEYHCGFVIDGYDDKYKDFPFSAVQEPSEETEVIGNIYENAPRSVSS